MARPLRLGLQRRIMLLVTVGLALIFSIGALLGLSAIDEATEQVFKERLATAQATVAIFQRDVDRLASDVVLLSRSDVAAAEAGETVADRVLQRVDEPERYPFFRVVGVTAVDADGRLVAVAPRVRERVPTAVAVPDQGGYAVAPATAVDDEGVPFFDIVVPLSGSPEPRVAALVAHTVSSNRASPFDPTGLGTGPTLPDEPDHATHSTDSYDLEVLGPAGTTLLAIGDRGEAGTPSRHALAVQEALDQRRPTALVDDLDVDHHVMAVVPIDGSPLSLVLEQPSDVALALPNRLREQLFVLIGAGFTTALLVAWVTTRRVTKPTAELTAAAARMAAGDLSEPIDVAAYDEIETLAATLESMRQRLLEAQSELVEVNRDLERRIEERTARLESVLRMTITAQEEERYALARELHDETAQTIAALSMALDRARHDALVGTDQGLERISEAKAIASRLLGEVRRLIMGLRPSILDDLGLGPAIAWYAETIMAERERPTNVTVDVPNERLPNHLEVALFRIAQEGLNNVAKHADASRAGVSLRLADTIELTIEDDGRGFDAPPSDADPAFGVGLAGMHERVALLGGTIIIDSEPGRGTRLHVRVQREQAEGS